MNDPKPGYKTTEFWLTLLANMVGAVMTSGLVTTESKTSQILGVVLVVLSLYGYTYHRNTIKRSNKPEAP